MGARILGVEYYLPDKILTNQDIENQYPDWNASKVEKKVGIRQRHIAANDESSLDLAVKAAERLLIDFDRKVIDFIIFCTQSPEYLLPTSACIIQDKLGLKKSIGALDFNLGCSGYIYGLALAKGLINSGISQNVLLLTGETYSKFIAKEDIGNRSIFGDAGSATIISRSDEEHIGEFVFGTDGKGAENLIVKKPTAKQGYALHENEHPVIYMNGPEIFNFTIEIIPSLISETLSKNNRCFNDISYLIMHQANKYMLDFLISNMGIDPGKCHVDLLNYGNTVSNTIPIALKDAIDLKIITIDDIVQLAGFGVGYSWGSVILKI